jgi:hypothetical protein
MSTDTNYIVLSAKQCLFCAHMAEASETDSGGIQILCSLATQFEARKMGSCPQYRAIGTVTPMKEHRELIEDEEQDEDEGFSDIAVESKEEGLGEGDLASYVIESQRLDFFVNQQTLQLEPVTPDVDEDVETFNLTENYAIVLNRRLLQHFNETMAVAVTAAHDIVRESEEDLAEEDLESDEGDSFNEDWGDEDDEEDDDIEEDGEKPMPKSVPEKSGMAKEAERMEVEAKKADAKPSKPSRTSLVSRAKKSKR